MFPAIVAALPGTAAARADICVDHFRPIDNHGRFRATADDFS
jgi:hypothetical protein